MLYFDHSATTPLRSEVKELMQSINDNNYGNPSSIYALGQKARSTNETIPLGSMVNAAVKYRILAPS